MFNVYLDEHEIFIESEESKTISGNAVFNKIKWIKRKNKDIWMMNQSHHGPSLKAEKWDRLAIVVDKSIEPTTVKFYQLGPGPLKWNESSTTTSKPFKVACFMCHSNGPRTIRPNYSSTLSPIEHLKIYMWNLRIKSYGKVVEDSSHTVFDKKLNTPFRWRGKYENEILKVKTCMKCHKDSGFMARGTLKRQHIPTIKFMIEKGHMPPIGFGLDENEKKALERFLEGF
ncbi:hypothetical protein OAB57_01055 [Bacteriovoracaceae bacterium]|nr:hypothetical protein [Bacteriovoracaceae bacterium]